MTFNINWNKNGVYLKFRGVVTAQDLIDANNYIISNAKFETINYQIFDFLDIEDFKITSYDITIIGSMNKSQSEFKENMKIAVLTNDDYIKSIKDEYDNLMKGSKWVSAIFPEIESANKWINQK